MGTGEFNAGVTLWWTNIPSRGEYNYIWSLRPAETEISSGLMEFIVLDEQNDASVEPIDQN